MTRKATLRLAARPAGLGNALSLHYCETWP